MIRYKTDILHMLKGFGYSQYELRNKGLLSASAMKALRENKPISFESLNTVCMLLNDIPVSEVIEYVPDQKENSPK